MTLMKELKVEVIGSDPPCSRCTLLRKRVEEVAKKLEQGKVQIDVSKRNILSPDVAKQYGVLTSPAIAVNDVVKVMGRVPEIDEIERILKKALT